MRATSAEPPMMDIIVNWSAELSAACASFEKCYAGKPDYFNKRVAPWAQVDMDQRTGVSKAGETLVHQINFLLAEAAIREPPAVVTSRWALVLPTLS